jgi:hypothetical protein
MKSLQQGKQHPQPLTHTTSVMIFFDCGFAADYDASVPSRQR